MTGQMDFVGTPDQYRMRRLQVFNWGTFDGLYDVPIAERGYLFVGQSGSGKTTLLDAISALLIPPKWTRFNAAAQETVKSARDRDLASYVRGAWADQKSDESGEIETKYLRSGATWSALAVTFRDQEDRALTLVQIFTLQGAANKSADVKRHYMIAEREFDLLEAEIFSQDQDLRRLKQTLPDLFYASSFSQYCERFRRFLGIESEAVLQLLHKTQSAKNLGDLNTFLRDYMLDKPPTFAAAEQLVREFAELNEAHKAVLRAREQVQVLTPARDGAEQTAGIRQEREEWEELKAGLDSYIEGKRQRLLESREGQLRIQVDQLRAEITVREGEFTNLQNEVGDLETRYRDSGGGQIEHLERELKHVERRRDDCLRRMNLLTDTCEKLDCSAPASPVEFAQLMAMARTRIESWQEQADGLRNEYVSAETERKLADVELQVARREIESMRRQPSNIPEPMLRLRAEMADALGIAEAALPFVGELIQVKAEHAAWTGAIERLLHNFALSVLVEQRHYRAVSDYVNKTSLAGRRIVYHRVEPVDPSRRHGHAPGLVIDKLEIKRERKTFGEWVYRQLEERFDFACAESMDAFRKSENALTVEGQIRRGDRHEKNDLYPISDRGRWVLGFDNSEKRRLYEERAQELEQQISVLQEKLKAISEAERQGRENYGNYRSLLDYQWDEIDSSSAADRVAAISSQLQEIRKRSHNLEQLRQQINAVKERVKAAEEQLIDRKAAQKAVEDKLRTVERELAAAREFRARNPLRDWQQQTLDDRLESSGKSLSLDNLNSYAKSEAEAFGKELRRLDAELNQTEKSIEIQLAEFKRRWPQDCANMDTSLKSLGDYMALLNRLETDGLPSHEHRFFDLLQNQSRQNLAALSTHLHQTRREIHGRIDQVNESLKLSPYNPDTHLQVQIKDRMHQDIIAFRQEVKDNTSLRISDDREEAEVQFIKVRDLVGKLSAQDPAAERWRKLALDVRQHVEFTPVEVDAGGAEVEVYRSGAGKSGGQRQKLATTVMAAALRYQLCGEDRTIPKYAPVVLDEAFDKADNEFTEQAMKIFVSCGFQMIVATPMKSITTLEAFIGGACLVAITDRRRSAIKLIEYDEAGERLVLPKNEEEHEPTAVSG